MNQINFLPDSFQKIRRRRQRRPVEFAVIVLTAVGLVGLWWMTGGPDPTLANQAAEIDQALLRIEQKQEEGARLEQERARLTGKLLIARETYQPIQTTEILARLSALTPEAVRLVEFELVAERPAPEALPGEKRGKRRVVSSAGDKRATKPREPNRMKLSLTGLAPTDNEIVQLIRKLEHDPVFSAVSLRNSRMTKTKTHFAREFKLDLEIDLDRRFVPTGNQGGASDAD